MQMFMFRGEDWRETVNSMEDFPRMRCRCRKGRMFNATLIITCARDHPTKLDSDQLDSNEDASQWDFDLMLLCCIIVFQYCIVKTVNNNRQWQQPEERRHLDITVKTTRVPRKGQSRANIFCHPWWSWPDWGAPLGANLFGFLFRSVNCELGCSDHWLVGGSYSPASNVSWTRDDWETWSSDVVLVIIRKIRYRYCRVEWREIEERWIC